MDIKKIINNYDWKLFCIESELELAKKEREHYWQIND
jgi:hypothetical protein